MEISPVPEIRKSWNRILRSDYFIMALFSGFSLLLHLICISQYDYFRDEFYYINCSDHLAFGYVDHPALAMLLLKGVRLVLGDSLGALRLLPVLSGALLVFGTGLLVRELGGKKFAVALGCAAAFGVLGNFFLFHIYSMNFLDHLFWLAGFLILVKIVKGGSPRLWLLFGLLAGLGLENKLSMLFLLLGTGIAILLLPELRRYWKSRWLWLGGGLAVLLLFPYVVWNITHGWPTLEFIKNASAYKNTALAPLAFFREQVLYNGPLSLLVWGAGLCFFIFTGKGRKYRFLGVIYLSIYLLFNLQHAKSYYLAPAYPALFAGGAVLWESLLQGRWRKIFGTAFLVLLLGASLALAPLMLPILPVKDLITYMHRIGFQPHSGENHKKGPLPQMFADMFGWRETTAKVAAVYNGLTAAERRDCLIYGDNYGIAGALAFFGRKYDLPEVFSGHNSHFFWFPQKESSKVMITVGADPEDLKKIFKEVTAVGRTSHPYAMPYENNKEICLVRNPQISLKELWPLIKKFN